MSDKVTKGHGQNLGWGRRRGNDQTPINDSTNNQNQPQGPGWNVDQHRHAMQIDLDRITYAHQQREIQQQLNTLGYEHTASTTDRPLSRQVIDPNNPFDLQHASSASELPYYTAVHYVQQTETEGSRENTLEEFPNPKRVRYDITFTPDQNTSTDFISPGDNQTHLQQEQQDNPLTHYPSQPEETSQSVLFPEALLSQTEMTDIEWELVLWETQQTEMRENNLPNHPILTTMTGQELTQIVSQLTGEDHPTQTWQNRETDQTATSPESSSITPREAQHLTFTIEHLENVLRASERLAYHHYQKPLEELTTQDKQALYAKLIKAGNDAKSNKKFNKPWDQLTPQEQQSIHLDLAKAAKDTKSNKRFNKPWDQLTPQEQQSIRLDLIKAGRDAKANKKFNKPWDQLTPQEQQSIHLDFLKAGNNTKANKKFIKPWYELTPQEQQSIHLDLAKSAKEKVSNMTQDQQIDYYRKRTDKSNNTRKTREAHKKWHLKNIDVSKINNAVLYIQRNITESIPEEQKEDRNSAIRQLKSLKTAKELSNTKEAKRLHTLLMGTCTVDSCVQIAVESLLPHQTKTNAD
jgi:hypothetical protein